MPGLKQSIPSTSIRRHHQCQLRSESQLHLPNRFSGRPSWPLGWAHLLATLIIAALTASAQAQSSVTLAWNPDAGTNIAAYKIYYGVASRTYTNTNNVGNVTNATISSLIGGTIYYFAATAVDTSGSESAYSTEVVYTNPVAAAPTIVLSSPVSGANYTTPATISCAATVTANGHTITKVQFYNGATLLSTVATVPYSFSWTNVSAGSYSLTAQAVYDSGSTVASTPANVTVTNVPLPSIALTAPANGASYTAPASISLAATVTANGHTITKVQFYNGATLLGTVAAAPYSFSWTNVSAGSYSLTAQAVYDSGSTATCAPVNVTCVNATSVVTIWPPTAVPATVDAGPDSAVELGVKFRSDIAGSIAGIRFYKATANTGTHLGHLWSSTGTKLATATFSGETASGWQQVSFATPVAIASNTVYVASYHASNGHYSEDDNYFASKGVYNPPLHALTNGVSGANGVYAYGASSAFPNQTWKAANYWVDVVFSTGTSIPNERAAHDPGSTPVKTTIAAPPTLMIKLTAGGTGTMNAAVQPAPTQIVLNATGQPGQAYNVLSSLDFQSWTLIGTLTLDASGSGQFTDPAGNTLTNCFYRLQGQ
jgi:sulfur relay (sulfurtransferase) complex TusBCD TusD component (DsrE family)